jgi:hypothetical protein
MITTQARFGVRAVVVLRIQVFWDVIHVVEPTVPKISKDDGDHSFEMRRITPPMMQQHTAGNESSAFINFI